MLEILKLKKILFIQNIMLINEFIFKRTIYSNCVNYITSIHCKLKNKNMIILLLKFDKVLKINVNIFVLKFNTCNIV